MGIWLTVYHHPHMLWLMVCDLTALLVHLLPLVEGPPDKDRNRCLSLAAPLPGTNGPNEREQAMHASLAASAKLSVTVNGPLVDAVCIPVRFVTMVMVRAGRNASMLATPFESIWPF